MSSAQSSSALALLRERQPSKRQSLTLLRLPSGEAAGVETDGFELGLGVTELAGIAGSGKTQISLGTCVRCASTQLESSCSTTRPSSSEKPFGKAIFVSLGGGTTEKIAAKRLSQMASFLRLEEPTIEKKSVAQILNRIITRFIRNQEEFDVLVFHELPRILQNDGDIAFISLDSLGAMFRNCDEKHSMDARRRSTYLFRVAAQLKTLSEKFKIPILIINQVSADFSSNASDSIIPSLGLSWANCVNESFIVSRREIMAATVSPTFHRTLHLRFSSSRKTSTARFSIDAGGALALPLTTLN